MQDFLDVEKRLSKEFLPTEEKPIIWYANGDTYKNDGKYLYYLYEDDVWIEDTENIKQSFK